MKIKIKELPYEKVLEIKTKKAKKPQRQYFLFRFLLRVLSSFELIATRFKYEKINMEKLGKKEPCLFLMNHSSFTDLKIASKILFSRPYNIISTVDAFIGKSLLMRFLGCIPTRKYINDVKLVRDMVYATKTLKSSVLMYPEASYSFDGTALPLPDSLGKCIKLLGVPVVMINTFGAFHRDPLYNNLMKRKVTVSARVEYILSPEQITEMSHEEINELLKEKFSFDGFRWQQENNIKIDEPFRAKGLNRVLYKCPNCHEEGKMVGEGTTLKCTACGKEYELNEYGFMVAKDGKTEFSHIPDWYKWQRECVKKELLSNDYSMNTEVDICIIKDHKCLYRVGEGKLTHSNEGFRLVGCDGKLDYTQKPFSSYTLNADYFWYEIGDIISFGDHKMTYYCFPKGEVDIVAKTRLATEELYKILREKKRKPELATSSVKE